MDRRHTRPTKALCEPVLTSLHSQGQNLSAVLGMMLLFLAAVWASVEAAPTTFNDTVARSRRNTALCDMGLTGPNCDIPHSDHCECGMYGPECDTLCDSDNTCNGNGHCSDLGECVCYPGFYGPSCISAFLTNEQRNAPVLSTASFITAGNSHSCAIRFPDNGLKCWGVGSTGALGQGDNTNRGGLTGAYAHTMGDALPVVNLGEVSALLLPY